jgi:hypothetical protein
MTFDYASLRDAIDRQNIEEVRAIITEHPEIDYSCVSSNGASILWWALMPPNGKNISAEVVNYLLGLTESDGNRLVSPVQAFAGLTPYRYLGLFENKFDNVQKLIRRAENEYRAPLRARENQRLAAIANDAQSAHNSLNAGLARGNIIRLYEHYVEKQSFALDEACCQRTKAEIDAFIDSLPDKNRNDYSQSKFGLDYCYSDTSEFAFKLSQASGSQEGQGVILTLAQLIALNWRAAKEDDVGLLPEGAANEEGLQSRKKALLNILFDIATAYGINQPSCAGGACNRLSLALAKMHGLVNARAESEPLKGEEAQIVIIRVLGRALEAVSEEDSERYANILCHLSAEDLTEEQTAYAEKTYHDFIESKKGALLETLVNQENIDEQIAKVNVDCLLEAYPTSGHALSYELGKLIPFINTSLIAEFLSGTKQPEKVADEAKNELAKAICKSKASKASKALSQKYPHTFKNKEAEDIALERINDFLTRARRQGSNLSLGDLMKGQIEEKDNEFIEDTFLGTLFLHHKETLKANHREQALWLDSLTFEQVIALLKAVGVTVIGALANNPEEFFQALVTKAIEQGMTANLVLDNITLKNMDLRGHNFSGIHINNATFENCMLPIAGDNIQCQGVKFINCTLPGLDEKDVNNRYFCKEMFWQLCAMQSPPSNLIVRFFLNKISLEQMKETSSNGDTALHVAVSNGHTEIVKAILGGRYDSGALLQMTSDFKETPLHVAASKGHTEIVKAILGGGYDSGYLLKMTDDSKETPLHPAAYKGHTEIVKIILESPGCSNYLLQIENTYGDTASGLADCKGHTEIVKMIERNFTYRKIWESTADIKDKIIALLSNYCDESGHGHALDSMRFFSGGSKPGHVQQIRALIDEVTCEKKDIKALFGELNAIPNQTDFLAEILAFMNAKIGGEISLDEGDENSIVYDIL